MLHNSQNCQRHRKESTGVKWPRKIPWSPSSFSSFCVGPINNDGGDKMAAVCPLMSRVGAACDSCIRKGHRMGSEPGTEVTLGTTGLFFPTWLSLFSIRTAMLSCCRISFRWKINDEVHSSQWDTRVSPLN